MESQVDAVISAGAKAALTGGVVAVVLYRTRQLPRTVLGFVPPPVASSALFLALYLGWMFGSDALIHWRGPWDFAPWIAAPLAASALRVLSVCVLGPVAEELIFRGWLYGVIERRWSAMPAIVITALGWAVLHYTYSGAVVVVIAVGGLLLGLARWTTRSVYPPIVMHMLYNLYAIW